ncbi:MAG: EVE domain-containing protein, partial [bacterium]|nr:EVE domain-containing protein [bacterium]
EKTELKYFGDSARSEIVGNLFADKYVYLNKRDKFALDFLGIDPAFAGKEPFETQFFKFNKAIEPLITAYTKIVGNKTPYPVNLEVDQFFSYIYQTYGDDKNKTADDSTKTIEKPLPLPTPDESSDTNGVTVNTPDSTPNFWWLNINPKQWKIDDHQVGQEQSYTSRNDKNNKRRIYEYFSMAKPGDMMIGYESTPTKKVKALFEITHPLHKNEEDIEEITFVLNEFFPNPITWKELEEIPALSDCQVLKNNQGSLFKLSPAEFEAITEYARTERETFESYTIGDALAEVFLEEAELLDILELLHYKKNIVIQGPPGVGKTFIAKKLAYLKMCKKDQGKIEMIQFHQSYSYEDFIQGYRPTDAGGFVLYDGVFHQFCRKAGLNPDKEYFFIIDEINRGNLGKIFGEIMMLMERDKRGRDFAIPLTYSRDKTFYIPENVYLIGTMNTADRSLALVDYALRRRFAFIDLKPKFESQKFRLFLEKFKVPDTIITKIITGITALNKKIAADSNNLGPGFKIGHSYFCPVDENDKYDKKWYENVIRTEVASLIREYWFDDEDKAENLINALSI